MKHKQRKFVIGSGLIILAVFFLAYSGYEENRTYSHTVPELYAMRDSAYGVRLQVSGNVVPGSIKREGSDVYFVVGQSPQTLPIRYVGKDPPDTLIDGATVLATGKMNRDGVFVADAILTKSASKTEHAELDQTGTDNLVLVLTVAAVYDRRISLVRDSRRS